MVRYKAAHKDQGNLRKKQIEKASNQRSSKKQLHRNLWHLAAMPDTPYFSAGCECKHACKGNLYKTQNTQPAARDKHDGLYDTEIYLTKTS